MHPGYEFLYILDGELELHHGEHHCTLAPEMLSISIRAHRTPIFAPAKSRQMR